MFLKKTKVTTVKVTIVTLVQIKMSQCPSPSRAERFHLQMAKVARSVQTKLSCKYTQKQKPDDTANADSAFSPSNQRKIPRQAQNSDIQTTTGGSCKHLRRLFKQLWLLEGKTV